MKWVGWATRGLAPIITASPGDYLTLAAATDGAVVTESHDFNSGTLDISYVTGVAFGEFYGQNAAASFGTLGGSDERSMMTRRVNDTDCVNRALSNIRPAQDWGPLAKIACL